jgi:Tol biopolymer transport system component
MKRIGIALMILARMLAQQPGPGDIPQEMVWVDRTGKVLGRAGAVQNSIFFPEISPDGRRIAVSARDGEANDRDVWIHDAAGGSKRVIAPARGNDNFPIWSADGKEIIFTSSRPGNYELFRKRVDSAEPEMLLLEMPESQYPRAWSPDGATLIFTHATPTGRQLMTLTLATQARKPLLNNPHGWADGARYSPDGKWIAYMANPGGLWEILVAPASGPNSGVKITRDLAQGWAGGGGQVRWRADGNEMFYIMGDALMALPFDGSAPPKPASAKRLFSTAGFLGNFPDEAPWLARYDVTADGQRFLFVRRAPR